MGYAESGQGSRQSKASKRPIAAHDFLRSGCSARLLNDLLRLPRQLWLSSLLKPLRPFPVLRALHYRPGTQLNLSPRPFLMLERGEAVCA